MRFVKNDLKQKSNCCFKNDLRLTNKTHRNNVNVDMLNTNGIQNKKSYSLITIIKKSEDKKIDL